MAPNNNTNNNWAASKGRKLLREDIRSGHIPADMSWKTAYLRRPEFAVGQTPAEAKRLFEGRLRAARKFVSDRTARAAEEEALLHEDEIEFPTPATDAHGHPRWEGSAAQKLLKQDHAAGLTKALSNDEFYHSRAEYQVYPASYIYRKKIQEERTRKFLNQYRGRYEYGEDDE